MSTASRYAQASAPCSAISATKASASSRFPCSRPCISVIAKTTVSISPRVTPSHNSSSVIIVSPVLTRKPYRGSSERR